MLVCTALYFFFYCFYLKCCTSACEVLITTKRIEKGGNVQPVLHTIDIITEDRIGSMASQTTECVSMAILTTRGGQLVLSDQGTRYLPLGLRKCWWCSTWLALGGFDHSMSCHRECEPANYDGENEAWLKLCRKWEFHFFFCFTRISHRIFCFHGLEPSYRSYVLNPSC